jgi:hypothetical protein
MKRAHTTNQICTARLTDTYERSMTELLASLHALVSDYFLFSADQQKTDTQGDVHLQDPVLLLYLTASEGPT